MSVTLEDVSKSYGDTTALKPLSLAVHAGELVSLLGPSGCGKTTTLRILAGFIRPDTGRVLLGARDVTEVAPNQRGLGMVFQAYSLFPHMSVAENVAFGLKIRGISRAERTARVREALETVRLGTYGDRMPQALSGGQQQRVALARALITRPAVLLLDEPLGALDKNLRERMQFEIRDLQRRLGITTVLVTHDQEEAMIMSDRVAVMSEGALVQIGSPTEVYLRPRTRFVSEFLGTSNLFQAIVAGEATGGSVPLRIAGATAILPAELPIRPTEMGAQVTVALRPEKLLIEAPGGLGVDAQVKSIAFRGSYYVYELDVLGRPDPLMAIRQTPLEVALPGSQVTVRWDEGAVILEDDAEVAR